MTFFMSINLLKQRNFQHKLYSQEPSELARVMHSVMKNLQDTSYQNYTIHCEQHALENQLLFISSVARYVAR